MLVTPAEINTPYIVKMLNAAGVEYGKIKVLEYELSYKASKEVKYYQYTSGGEDSIICMIIKMKFRMNYRDVRYLELGVWSPVVKSNTYALYLNGAKGVLVDANPEIIDWCKYVRFNDRIINAAIFDGDKQNGFVDFYIASPDKSTCSLSKDFIISHGQSIERTYRISTVSLNSLLDEFEQDVTLLSVDLEGYDMTAIKSIDFKRYRPRIIIMEVALFDLEEVKCFFASVDYSAYWTDRLNAIFMRNEELRTGLIC